METLLLFVWAGTSYMLLTPSTRWYGVGLGAVAVAVLVVLRRPTVYRPALA